MTSKRREIGKTEIIIVTELPPGPPSAPLTMTPFHLNLIGTDDCVQPPDLLPEHNTDHLKRWSNVKPQEPAGNLVLFHLHRYLHIFAQSISKFV